MEALLAKATPLRAYLQRAAKHHVADGDAALEQNLHQPLNEDVAFALDHTFLIQSHIRGVDAFPRSPWSSRTFMSHTELVNHAIEQLLARKRAIKWEDANILTLGYREVTPGATGHRVTESNGVMCYYPNTLVATLKKPLWGTLHKLMGDDLMMHLLLNYTMLVQLKHTPGSYMQLTGKSLRQHKHQEQNNPLATAKCDVSINQVMYARSFKQDQVFANTHVLVKASKANDPISRAEACRILRSIFSDATGKKRLPKRLINLIPIIQATVSRFKAIPIKKLARKLIPLDANFCKFMVEHPVIKRKRAERAADRNASMQPMMLPILHKALEDGYLSQGEGVIRSSDRKRKRREEAIELLSNASLDCSKNTLERTKHSKTNTSKVDDDGEKNRSACDMTGLMHLQKHKEDIKQLLAYATPKKKIFRLIRKLVTGIVPKELWGSNGTTKNWKRVKTLLQKFIFSQKFDSFSLKKCAEQFQVTNIEWMNLRSRENIMCPVNELVKRQKLVQELLWWVFSSIVFPLLRNLFYITDSEGMANEVAFYQRPVWNAISTLALSDLEGGILQPSSIRSLPNERHLGTSRMRLLPKAHGIRPLMNLSSATDRTQLSVNRSLEAVHRVLTFEMERQPQRLVGASVQNIDDVYKRLKPLFRQISQCPRCAERRRLTGATSMTYCVTVDVERCFDTIRPRKLYQMLKKALREEEYLIRKHWIGHQVAPISSSVDQVESLPPSSFFFKLKRPAYPSGEFLSFDELAAQCTKENALLVDGILYDYLTKEKALQLLKEHLTANVVEMDGQEFVQQCGIPQGSVLSTTLCTIYYAYFEQRVLCKHLPKVGDPAPGPNACCHHEKLLRYTDDFMFITTDLNRAQTFFDVMHEGNQEYGCFVNITKTQVNFPVKGTSVHVLEVEPLAPKALISWCGMLIDPNCLQIYVNYEKLGRSLLQASISFNETKAVQRFFVNKVIAPIRQRWHALYFDPDLLSQDSIYINLFQTFVVTAHRFLLLIDMLPYVNRGMHFFHHAIHRILTKMTRCIRRNLVQNFIETGPTAEHWMQSSNRMYDAQKAQIWTVGLYTFQFMIRAQSMKHSGHGKEQANWPKVLDAIRTEQEKLEKRANRLQVTAARDLEWLLHDQRNECVLQQFCTVARRSTKGLKFCRHKHKL